MHGEKRWNILPQHELTTELASRLKTSPLIAQILLTRGYADPGDCAAFLRPSLKHLHEPATLPGVPRAADRIARAIRDREKVVLYGDYDVDGITATAILWHAIRALGGTCEYYIPHRIDEGYGLNAQAIEQLCASGARVIVTVDCGITACEQAALARERGVDLIVTDHHEWHESEHEDGGSRIEDSASPSPPSSILHPPSSSAPLLPHCYVIVHPRLPKDDGSPPYANPVLCGAGVAFKLAWAVGLAMTGGSKVGDSFRAFLIDATALAALGTIADVVPLTGENRVMAHFGLGGLKQSRLVGIRALIASAGLTGQNLDSFDVGFRLAPRLNACGRMGHAREAVEMLTTPDEARAMQIATALEAQNRTRQATERKIVEQAVAQVTELGLDKDGQCAIVLGHESWHPGVIGIVASRIVERYHRPAVMVALSNGHGQGSGRSIAGFHLARALHACAEHLDGYGGHEMAAGLKVRTEKFNDFRDAFCAHAKSCLTPQQLVPEMKLDGLAELHQITEAVVNDLHRLGPFGHGNRRPLLCCRGLQISAPPRRVGPTGDHLQLHVRQGDHFMKCIAFGYGRLYDHLQVGTNIDLAVEPTLNHYNGRTTVELEVKDVQFPQV